MESIKWFALLLVFHVSRLSRSQQPGTCDTMDVPNCRRQPPPPPDQWVSNIMGEMVQAPPINGTGGYVVRWELDPSRPNAAYIVTLREFENPEQLIRPPRMVPAGTLELLIEDLTIGVEYVASVCYANTSPPQFPAINEFTPPCGLCDVCFVVAPAPLPPEVPMAPDIIVAERVNHRGMGGIKTVHTCAAIGSPLPNITWEAFNAATGETVTLRSDSDGIEIVTIVGQSEVTSDLTIFTNSNFSSPTCLATNEVDVVRQGMFENVMRPTPPMPVTTPGDRMAPMITVAERVNRRMGGIRAVYTCVASGTPLPTITWEACNDETLETVLLDNEFDGIEIITIIVEGMEVSSDLTLFKESDFNSPTCIATNEVDVARKGMFQNVMRPPPGDDRMAPVIILAERVELRGEEGIRTVYTCEAIGVPVPDITWEASNIETGETVLLDNELDGIEIETVTEEEDNEVSSDLTIFTDSDFDSPRCIATNEVDVDRERMFERVMPPPPRPAPTAPFPEYAIAILVIMPIVLLILVVIIVVCVLSRRKKQHTKMRTIYMAKTDDRGSLRADNNLKIPVDPITTVEMSPATQRAVRKASLINKLPQNMILSSDVLQVSTIIGQGEFGVVYKGYLKQSDVIDTVAVKTLKGIFVTARDIENVTAEILKMSKFDHPNVMRLIGVCLAPSDNDGGTGPCIVMPFMSKGSLLDFLRKESDNLFVASEKDPKFFEVRKQLLQFSLQVAKGMEYLASLRFIHRDLAARNCLMDANNVIKISDFGLSEDIYSQNYFRQMHSSGIKLPLKWMALESIKLGLFTEKTDVWSYGVTCWEIFNGGAIPYPGVHPQNVLSYLEDGGRLERPKNAVCCDGMYNLMLGLWSKKAEARPNFESIVNTLTNYLVITSDYLDLSLMDIENNSCQGKVASMISAHCVEELEEDPEHSITRVPAQANDYTMAGPSI